MKTHWGKYLILGLVTLVFAFSGFNDIFHSEFHANMARLGFPLWFTVLLGIGKLAALSCVWYWKKYKPAAVVLLFGIVSGAIAAHRGVGDPIAMTIPSMVVWTLLVVYLGWEYRFFVKGS